MVRVESAERLNGHFDSTRDDDRVGRGGQWILPSEPNIYHAQFLLAFPRRDFSEYSCAFPARTPGKRFRLKSL
jgi:hypothetical protein